MFMSSNTICKLVRNFILAYRSPSWFPNDVIDVDNRGVTPNRSFPNKRGRGKFLLTDHVAGGTVRERLTVVPRVIRHVIFDVIKVPRWRKRLRVSFRSVLIIIDDFSLIWRGPVIHHVDHLFSWVLGFDRTITAGRVAGRTRLFVPRVTSIWIF